MSENEPPIREAACPMCGRDCDHGRLSPNELVATDAAPFDYRSAHRTATTLLDSHHQPDNARAVVAAFDRNEAICPVCAEAPR